MKKLFSLFLCLILLFGLLPMAAPATAADTAITVSSIKANKTSAKTGEAITWTASASGGSGSLQYYFRIYKDGTLIKKGSYGTAKTFTYTPKQAGSYKAKVYVKDSSGKKVSKLSAAVNVTASSAIVVSSMQANKTSAEVGEPIIWNAAASGGSGSLQYCFRIYRDGSLVKKGSYSSTKAFTYTPKQTGSYKAKVYVKDASGAKVSKLSAAVTVTEGTTGIVVDSIMANKSSAEVGEPIIWIANASGGTGTLQYCFRIYKDGDLVKKGSYGTTKAFTFTPTETGSYKAKVYVKDASGAKVSKLSLAVSVQNYSLTNYGLVTYLYQGIDDWGAIAYYAQIVLANGSTVTRLPITKAAYESVLAGSVYKLSSTGSLWNLTVPGWEVITENYNASVYNADYSGANYIQFSGYAGSLIVQLNQRTPDPGAVVITLSSLAQTSAGAVRKVKAVWFTSSVTPVSNSFIYVASTEIITQAIVNGAVVSYYDGYLNGVRMTDLLTASPPTRTGFALFSKDNITGVYTLRYLADGNGSASGVRTVTLESNSDPNVVYYSGIDNGYLYLRDSLGTLRGLSLSGVTVVKTGVAAYSPVPINSVYDLVYAVNTGYKVTVTLVENVSGGTHSVGGSAIYVTAITQ